jgi:hypothetical protein
MNNDHFEDLIMVLTEFRDKHEISSTEMFGMMISFVAGAAVSGGLEKDEALMAIRETVEYFYGAPLDD